MIQYEKNARLTLVATPIGRADDITLHAIEVLKSADVLLAEDTRVLRKLLKIHEIALNGRTILAYHEHNTHKQNPLIQQLWAQGKSIAYTSDAGTPLISDPGFELVRAAQTLGIKIEIAPGASALIAALCLSGQSCERFFFGGFLPSKRAERQKELCFFNEMNMTGVYFESPKRLLACLRDIAQVCGQDQQLSVCREMTKKFQDIVKSTVTKLLQDYENREAIKGEIVLVLARNVKIPPSENDIKKELTLWLQDEPVRLVAQRAAAKFGIARKEAYQLALDLKAKPK